MGFIEKKKNSAFFFFSLFYFRSSVRVYLFQQSTHLSNSKNNNNKGSIIRQQTESRLKGEHTIFNFYCKHKEITRSCLTKHEFFVRTSHDYNRSLCKITTDPVPCLARILLSFGLLFFANISGTNTDSDLFNVEKNVIIPD